MRLLITGANGFVGKLLCAELLRQGQSVRAAVRSASSPVENIELAVVGSLGSETDWTNALRGVDAVIHLAARVHVMKEAAADPLAEFLMVNLHGTENLAQQAAKVGVKRFVYVSSIKVNGESTLTLKPSSGRRVVPDSFTAFDKPHPQDPYAQSKWAAEQALWRIARSTGLEVVIVRPPLIYGPRVGGNFLRLLHWVWRGVPLPLASLDNQRSLLYLGNLVDALLVCLNHPQAVGQTYLLSDGENFSTPGLMRALAEAMDRPCYLWPCPAACLDLAGRLLGKGAEVERLTGSLVIDSAAISRDLGWQPRFSARQGFAETAAWFMRQTGHV